jgi:recombination associated protein RdgC
VGLLKGSVSYTKFFVQGEVPDDFRDRFLEAIRLRAFTPLVPEEEDEERVGWCPFDAPYAPESGFDYNSVFYNQYLNLAFRADRWRFPGPVFRALFDKMAKAYLEKQGRAKLAKREKEELKVMVGRKLRKQFSPAVQVVELSWDLNAGVCRFGHQSLKVHEHLHELFEKTFALKLLASSPFADALNAKLPGPCLDALGRVEPAVFHTAAAS